ncbi:MAG TPA: murein biosynthesis integral membrane protein MurJ [Longimicrobiales bacterium]
MSERREQEGSAMRPGPAEASDQESPGPSSVETPDGPRAEPRGGSAAYLVAAGIFLSRIAGLVRQRFIAGALGVSLYSDAFNLALRMPNFLQNLLGEGTLSASFIPVYSRLLKEGRKEEAGRVAGAVFALLLVLAGILGLVGFFAAPLLVTIGAPKWVGEQRALTIACVRIIFPMTAVLVLSAWALGVQNSHRKFFVSYVAPVLWNAAIIATLILFGRSRPEGGLTAPAVAEWLSRLTVALAWGALIGGVLQFLIQVPFVLRLERSLRVGWAPKLPEVREIVHTAGPAIAGRGVVQASALLDIWLAGLISTGSVTAMQNALLLYMLPISLFGMSVAASELPDLARERLSGAEQMRERVNSGLRQIYFFVVPSFIAFVVLGDVIVGGILQNGVFGPAETLQTYVILAAFSLGLVASTGTRLFSSTFFALGDTRTPAKVAFWRVIIAGVLGAALMFPFDRIHVNSELALGAAGLGLGSSIAAWYEWWTLRRTLGGKVGHVGAGAGILTRMFAAAIVAAAAGRAIAQFAPIDSPLMRAVVVLPPVGLLYLLLTGLAGVPQSRRLVNRVLRR